MKNTLRILSLFLLLANSAHAAVVCEQIFKNMNSAQMEKIRAENFQKEKYFESLSKSLIDRAARENRGLSLMETRAVEMLHLKQRYCYGDALRDIYRPDVTIVPPTCEAKDDANSLLLKASLLAGLERDVSTNAYIRSGGVDKSLTAEDKVRLKSIQDSIANCINISQ